MVSITAAEDWFQPYSYLDSVLAERINMRRLCEQVYKTGSAKSIGLKGFWLKYTVKKKII
jgi:hypothetical protein